MRKKLFWLMVIGFGVAYAANHTRVGKNVVTIIDRTVDSVSESFGSDVELGTLKRDLRKLESEQVKIQSRYATAKVDADRLANQVVLLKKDLETGEHALLKQADELKKAGDNSRVNWKGITISLSEGKERLQIAVDQIKAKKAQLAADEQRLAYLEKDRDVLGQQLSAFKAEVARMHSEIAKMEAELKQLRVEQIRQRQHPENSDLGDVKEAADRLARKIAIEREKLNLSTDRPQSDVGNKSVEEILKGLND
jgi:chromosome segregation ATPase